MKPAEHFWINNSEQYRVLAVTEDELVLLWGNKNMFAGLTQRLESGTCTKDDLAGGTRLAIEQLATIEKAEESGKVVFSYIRESDGSMQQIRYEFPKDYEEAAQSVAQAVWGEVETLDAPQGTREVFAVPGIIALVASGIAIAMLAFTLFPDVIKEPSEHNARALMEIALILGTGSILLIWAAFLAGLGVYVVAKTKSRPRKELLMPKSTDERGNF